MQVNTSFAFLLLALTTLAPVFLPAAPPVKSVSKKSGTRKTKAPSRKVRRPAAPVVSPAVRAAARERVEARMGAEPDHIEGADSLRPFFEKLARSKQDGNAVHILHYGDSHTASDDWPDTMRKAFQQKFGDGGPGFALAGYPFRGYRRYDVRGTSSPGWLTAGTIGHAGDQQNGLGGLSVTASRSGEAVSFTTTGTRTDLWFLRQPGGGAFSISDNDAPLGIVETDAALGTGVYTLPQAPGEHVYRVVTTSRAPVRLFGWVSENAQGVSWETLGVNGQQARSLLDWDPVLLKEQLQRRAPGLIVLAYGTNEALYPHWTREVYKTQLLTLIANLKQAVPGASILLVGPPECGRVRPFPYLQQVVEVQSEVAKETGSAFWNWALHMHESGGRAEWVRAGLSQADYTHLTADGYRLLGKTIAEELILEYRRRVSQELSMARVPKR